VRLKFVFFMHCTLHGVCRIEQKLQTGPFDSSIRRNIMVASLIANDLLASFRKSKSPWPAPLSNAHDGQHRPPSTESWFSRPVIEIVNVAMLSMLATDAKRPSPQGADQVTANLRGKIPATLCAQSVPSRLPA
jgi:hypothetical protein